MNYFNQPNNTPNMLGMVSGNPFVVYQDAHLLSVLDHGCYIDAYPNPPVLQGTRTPIYKLYPVKNGDPHLSLIQILVGGEML